MNQFKSLRQRLVSALALSLLLGPAGAPVLALDPNCRLIEQDSDSSSISANCELSDSSVWEQLLAWWRLY